MTTVLGTLIQPDGTPATGIVYFYLVGDDGPVRSAFDQAGNTIVSESRATLDGTGSYSVALTGNDDIVPAGTVWARAYNGGRVIDTLDVPTSGGPYDEADILLDPPGSIAPTELAAHIADTTVHGGTLIASATRAGDMASSSSTAATTGMSFTFTHPGRPYKIEAQGRIYVPNSGQIGTLEIYASINGGTAVNAVGNGWYNAAGSLGIVGMDLPVPGPQGVSAFSPDWHKPVAGDEVTYDLRFRRSGGGGTVYLSVEDDLGTGIGLLGKSPPFLRAVAC